MTLWVNNTVSEWHYERTTLWLNDTVSDWHYKWITLSEKDTVSEGLSATIHEYITLSLNSFISHCKAG